MMVHGMEEDIMCEERYRQILWRNFHRKYKLKDIGTLLDYILPTGTLTGTSLQFTLFMTYYFYFILQWIRSPDMKG